MGTPKKNLDTPISTGKTRPLFPTFLYILGGWYREPGTVRGLIAVVDLDVLWCLLGTDAGAV